MMLLVLVPLGTVTSAGAKPGRGIGAAERELIVREAYRRLATLVEAGGDHIGFELSNLRTIEAANFGDVYWADLVTFPGGLMVDVVPERHHRDGAITAIAFRAQWQPNGAYYAGTAEGLRLSSLRIDEVLAEVGQEGVFSHGVEAVTSYDVTVSLQERSRSYKAAVLWLPAGPGRDASLFFADHITQGVEEAVRQPDVVPQPVERGWGGQDKLACTPSTATTDQFLDFTTGNSGHVDGKHYTMAIARWTCSCDAQCTSEAKGELLDSACVDHGLVWDPLWSVALCHKMNAHSAFGVHTKFSATGSGASTKGGYTCGMRSCPACLCGVTVGVGISGAGLSTSVSFSSTNAEWHPEKPFEITCPPCAATGGGGGGPNPGGPRDLDPVDPGGSPGGSSMVLISRTPNGSTGGHICCYKVTRPDGTVWKQCSPCP